MNKNIIVIGDIHHHITEAEEIASKYEDTHTIVFTGDYFDDWHDGPATAIRTARWLKSSIYKPNRIHLLGNHDIAYSSFSLIGGRKLYNCSGWTNEKQVAIDTVLINDDWKRIKLFHYQYEWFFTHAGLHRNWIEHPVMGCSHEWVNKYLEAVTANYFTRVYTDMLWAAGRCRGGRHGAGGILWHDHQRESAVISGIRQVYGHTPTTHTMDNGIDIDSDNELSANICIDCGLKEVWLIRPDGTAGAIDTGLPNFYFAKGGKYEE